MGVPEESFRTPERCAAGRIVNFKVLGSPGRKTFVAPTDLSPGELECGEEIALPVEICFEPTILVHGDGGGLDAFLIFEKNAGCEAKFERSIWLGFSAPSHEQRADSRVGNDVNFGEWFTGFLNYDAIRGPWFFDVVGILGFGRDRRIEGGNEQQ